MASLKISTLFCVGLAAIAALPQPVKTGDGPLSGVSDGGIVAFKGIPFAAPPVGDLRWRAPKPVTPWTGVRRADRFGASCPQNIVEERKPWTYEFMAHNETSEDCLYLNVWTPAKSAAEKLPVFVWIYGGGFVEGSSAVPVYDGAGLASKGLVVVTVNYRVGVIGFLAHPDLTRESDRNSSGNYGLLDQLAALEWVKRNIAAFGGDPNRVTIAGQSAGAASVHALVASPLAKGLFHRAIAQSGSGIRRLSPRPLAEAEQAGVKLAEAKGAKSIAELRVKPWQDLQPGMRFGVTVDGWFLPMDAEAAIAAGKHSDVPMITGLTADEGSASRDYGAIPADAWRKQIVERFGEDAAVFHRLYPSGNADEARAAQIESARDQGAVSMYLWAANRQKTSKSPVYTYYWDHAPPGPDSARFAAFHTSEVPYTLHSLSKSNRPWSDADRKVESLMSTYWANFARTGNPNGKGLPAWKAFRADDKVTMRVGAAPGARPVADAAKLDLMTRVLLRPPR